MNNENWYFDSVVFIIKLLIRKPNLRLEFNGIKKFKKIFSLRSLIGKIIFKNN